MVVYSIKDMENLSGVKAHTIRIWEKRYSIIKPKRTATNIRYYTDEDLRHLLNVCLLYNSGHKISKIAAYSDAELQEKTASISKINLDFKDQLDALMLFILNLDACNLNAILDHYIAQIGLIRSMNELIYPLLDKISLAWLTGSFQGVHESFVTQIIKSKIQTEIEKLPEDSTYYPTYVIYLPQSEKQELSLLYLHYILKQNKCKVVSLGTDVNLVDVIVALNTLNPNYLFSFFNEEISQNSFQNYVNQISKNIQKGQFLVTGYQAVSLKIDWPENTSVLKDLNETLKFITKSIKEFKISNTNTNTN